MRVLLIGAIALAAVLSLPAQNDKGGKKKGGGAIPAPLTITIPAFSDGSAIPGKYDCAAGKNPSVSPAIQWSNVPAGTQTIALILHDTDVDVGGEDVLHWAIYNIPVREGGLLEGVPHETMLPNGATQLKNIVGSIGYFNPCPPPPTTHHYLFEFYALDTRLPPDLATRADLLAAMKGHVKAKGLYVGLFKQM